MVIYNYQSYRELLIDWMGQQPRGGRGLRSRLAEVISTNSAFVTQVMNGQLDFSLEQGLRICKWIGLSSIETDYFIALLETDRAGTPELKQYFKNRLELLRQEGKNLSKRLQVTPPSERIDLPTYFSSWTYAAVHVALTCEKLNTVELIEKQLRIPQDQVRRILDNLVSWGLAARAADRFISGPSRMHLGTDSPWLLRHHLNWTLKSLAAMESDIEGGLHYSSVVSVSQKDAVKLRELLTEAIANLKATVKESPGEEIYAFNLNYFEV